MAHSNLNMYSLDVCLTSYFPLHFGWSIYPFLPTFWLAYIPISPYILVQYLVAMLYGEKQPYELLDHGGVLQGQT
jgi:hypothetical protein